MTRILWAIEPNSRPNSIVIRNVLEMLGDDNKFTKRRMACRQSEVIGSVGVVPVKDTLYTSDYIKLSAQIEEMNANENVLAVLLDINSPGGMVSGAMECASTIRKSRKPVFAYIEGQGCSAAYLMASAAHKIIATPQSDIGSIGVMASWTNNEGLLAKLGIVKTYYYSGNSENKNRLPSTEEGAAAIAKSLNELETLFVASIAQGRKTTSEAVLEKYGHGLVFHGEEAKNRGMVDEIVTDFGACLELIQPQSGGEGETGMAENITTLEALTAAYPDIVAQAIERGKQAGIEEAKAAEKARVESIMALAEFTDDMGVLAQAIKDGKTADQATRDILMANKAAKDAQTERDKQELNQFKGESDMSTARTWPVSQEAATTGNGEVDAVVAAARAINAEFEKAKGETK